jgi:hypothetical protein
VRRLWGTALLLMLFSAGMWFAWLGWDHEYYLVNGVAQGPYRPWQVVGCGVAIAAATVLGYLRVRRTAGIFVLAAAAVVGFTVPWSVDASGDETGMWVVGLFFLLLGGGAGLVTLLAVTAAVAKPDASPSSCAGWPRRWPPSSIPWPPWFPSLRSSGSCSVAGCRSAEPFITETGRDLGLRGPAATTLVGHDPVGVLGRGVRRRVV